LAGYKKTRLDFILCLKKNKVQPTNNREKKLKDFKNKVEKTEEIKTEPHLSPTGRDIENEGYSPDWTK